MKKIVSMILFVLFLGLASPVFAKEQKPDTLVIHYYRYDDQYTNFNIWLWEKLPTASGGIQFNFNSNDVDQHGAFITINLSDQYANATILGIIIKQGGWDGYREVGGDRFMDLEKMENKDGTVHAYFAEQELAIGTSDEDLANHIPDYRPRILSASFKANKAIQVRATHEATLGYDLFENGSIIKSVSTPLEKTFEIVHSTIDISQTYTVRIKFSLDRQLDMTVSMQNIYDTPEFEALYTYQGTLGVSFESDQTVFRLWAPLSQKIQLNLYHQGHPEYNDLGVANKEALPFETHDLVKIENGAWEIKLSGDYSFKYYTFTVTNGAETNEVTDPYAYSTGANGLRGMIVDFKALNPNNWTYGERPNTITNFTDYIVYELHVRDLTSHQTWNGNEQHRGKFLGLTDTNTTYTKNGTTVTTGLDHIAELGVNAVQLLPIFDFGYIDEVEIKNNPNYKNTFNWGYMPYHFNTLEGSYATNPFDGKTRITEFKQAVLALHHKDLRVIMDVVYNHTGESETSNFHKIVPGYYHRLTQDGGFSNGSGTGNETASERSMMRKFMIDSVSFWATEYNLSGFRFDLMALHDVETMNAIRDAVNQIDPSIVLYGEPWTGGTSPLPENEQAGKLTIKELDNVGAFNDFTRDAIKGSVFQASEAAWVQGNTSSQIINNIKYGIVGGTNYPNIGVSAWHLDPNKTINYVSAHDNNTLHDKLRLTGIKGNQIAPLQIQANALILTSQGIPFLHAGVEFARSKPTETGSYDHNSYESPDSVNQMRWDRKIDYLNVFTYYKDLIQIRKNYSHFRMNSADDIKQRLTFLETTNAMHGIAYELKGLEGQPDVVVIHSGNDKTGILGLTLPSNKQYQVLTTFGNSSENSTSIVEGTIYIPNNTTSILVEVTNPLIKIKEKNLSVEKNATHNPASNIDILGDYDAIHYSKIDTSIPGLKIVTIAVTSTYGKTYFYTYQLRVKGGKYSISIGGLS